MGDRQVSMVATTIALRGVRMFLTATRAAVQRRPPQPPPKPRRKPKPVLPANKLPPKTLGLLVRASKFNKDCVVFTGGAAAHLSDKPLVAFYDTHGQIWGGAILLCRHHTATFWIDGYNRNELEALYTMYRKLVATAQAAAPPPVIGQPPTKIDGVDQSTFRDVMHNTFDLVTEEAILERVWTTWERGAAGGEGALKFESWVKGLSILLRGTDEERRNHCFAVYDLNGDGYITRDEMFLLLKNSLLKQPGDEDPDEGVRDLVELVLKKLDVDKDGRVSPEDYKEAVQQEPLLLEAFGQCLPSRRHAAAFLKTLSTK